VVDIDGDGLPDIIRYSGPTTASGGSCGTYGSILIFMNKGNGQFTKATLASPALPIATGTNWKNFLLFDVNGDGRVDIVTAVAPPASCATTVCARLYLGNGDGTFTEATSSNIQHLPVVIPPVAGMAVGSGYVTDIDGDGQLDIVTSSLQSWNGSFVSYRSMGNGNFESTLNIACPTPLDVNGDGKMDCINHAAGALYVNDGKSTKKTSTYNLTASDTLGSNMGVVVLDANRDGRSDLLRWVSGPTSTLPNELFLSNGDGTFRKSSLTSSFNLGTTPLKTTDGSVDFVLGDFTGHGATELLVMKTSGTNQLFLKTDASPPDLLTSVTTPMGIQTTLAYEPLSNSTSYVSGRDGTAKLPLQDLSPPAYVVVGSTTTTGIGSSSSTRQFAYKGLRSSLDGRGSAGFAQTTEQGKAPDGSDLAVVTDYIQLAPYAGFPAMRQTYKGTIGHLGARLSRATFSYCDTTSASAATDINTSSPAAPTPCASTALVKRPYAYQVFEESWDLNGVALPTKLTTSRYDSFNDLVSQTVTTSGAGVGAAGSQSFIETTTSKFCAPRTDGQSTAPICASGAANPHSISAGAWQLGHPTKVTVQRTSPDTRPATSAGSAPLAAATQGTGKPPVPPAAALTAVLQLLLSVD